MNEQDFWECPNSGDPCQLDWAYCPTCGAKRPVAQVEGNEEERIAREIADAGRATVGLPPMSDAAWGGAAKTAQLAELAKARELLAKPLEEELVEQRNLSITYLNERNEARRQLSDAKRGAVAAAGELPKVGDEVELNLPNGTTVRDRVACHVFMCSRYSGVWHAEDEGDAWRRAKPAASVGRVPLPDGPASVGEAWQVNVADFVHPGVALAPVKMPRLEKALRRRIERR